MPRTYSTEGMRRAIEAAEIEASYEDVGEYGYGGEIFPHTIVSNWPEVVRAAINAYESVCEVHNGSPCVDCGLVRPDGLIVTPINWYGDSFSE